MGVGRALAAQAFFDALADERLLVFLGGEDLGQGLLDPLGGDALLAELAGDAVVSQAAMGSARAGVAAGEALVVQPAASQEVVEDGVDVARVQGTAGKFVAEFLGGVGAAGEGSESVGAKPFFIQPTNRAAGRAFSP